MIRGFDTCAIQGILPFKQLVAQGLRFAILQGQRGNDSFDPLFWRNVQGCIENGIVPGVYNFTYPLPHLDPKQQAQLFFERCKGFGANKGELPPCIDFEWPAPLADGVKVKKGWKEWKCEPQQLSDWQYANAQEHERLWGLKPVIYFYKWFFDCLRDGIPGKFQGADVSWIKDYRKWPASYIKAWPVQGQHPTMPKPIEDDDWLIWQWDGDGGFLLPNGVDADFDVFNGTEEDLQNLANHLGNTLPAPPDADIVHNNDDLIEELVRQYQARVTPG